MEVEVAAGPQWGDADWAAVAAAAVRAATTGVDEGGCRVEVSVKFTGDAEVRDLNQRFRGKDAPTNVLSFPMVQPDLIGAWADIEDGEILLGDIVLARETVEREAAAKGTSVVAHVTHLIVHGTLHLLGHDHAG